MKRSATAVWKGSGKEGSGHISSQSNSLYNAFYAWNTRFENQRGTNPEELIAAAHAGCFTMKLSFVLGEAGFTPEQLETKSEVSMENGVIKQSHLTVRANVPGISKEKFEECASNAKENCPVSKALNMEITLEASLTQTS
jgi:osmotically inducible protein OsmC